MEELMDRFKKEKGIYPYKNYADYITWIEEQVIETSDIVCVCNICGSMFTKKPQTDYCPICSYYDLKDIL